MQVGTDIEEVAAEKTFPEPRLAIFADSKNMNAMQAFIIGEGKVLFEVLTCDSIIESIISLFATYYAMYVSYPKAPPASGLLLFIQEILMGVKEITVKKTVRYSSFTNSLHLYNRFLSPKLSLLSIIIHYI